MEAGRAGWRKREGGRKGHTLQQLMLMRFALLCMGATFARYDQSDLLDMVFNSKYGKNTTITFLQSKGEGETL